MKKFEDLDFSEHNCGIGGKQSKLEFDNGYGVSVLFGKMFYSNGIDTYEVGILYDGSLTYDTDITDDVIGYISKDEVTEIMKQVQEL